MNEALLRLVEREKEAEARREHRRAPDVELGAQHATAESRVGFVAAGGHEDVAPKGPRDCLQGKSRKTVIF